ncbi:MAG: CDP-glucose 4,6-dehydratase [Flavobacteriaceae bacterium]|nr:CDP-glucose 4,6-dehydratase [Flavobacteriaceae bacterium]
MGLKEVIHFYKGKRIFVTGHTGFKGSWLLYLLDSVGAKVTGYSLAPQTTPSLFNSLHFSKNIISVIGDIRDKEKFQNAFNKCNPEFVFHLAAQPLVMESYKNPKETFDINFTGTLNLLEILKDYNQKVQAVFITTDKVYENLELGIPFLETDKLGGKDPYSASKAASEILIDSYIKSFFKDSNVSIATARAGNVIGGGDWSENRLIPDIIRAKNTKKPLTVRNPKAVRPWQHVLEPLFGYLKLGIGLSYNPESHVGPWNFGPEINDIKSVREIIDIGKKLEIVGEVVFEESPLIEAQCLMLNISKAKKELNFKPKWNSEKAIERAFKWYLNFNNASYSNQLIENDLNKYIHE